MGPIAFRRGLRRNHRRVAFALASLVIVAGVALHHSDPQMGGMHHEGTAASVLEVCLGVLTAVGATVVAVALGSLSLGRWRLDPDGLRTSAGFSAAPAMSAIRAGPARLCFLGVLRL